MVSKKESEPQASKALLEVQRRFNLALQAAGAGAWEWDIATNRTHWSEGNYLILGLPPGSGEATYEDWFSRVHPDDRDRAQREVETAIRNRSDLDFEYRAVWPDGSVRWIRDVGKMMLDDSGDPIGMFGIQIDITDRRALEEHLRQSQKMEAMGRIAGAVAHDFNNLLTVVAGNAGRLRPHLSSERELDSMVSEILHAVKRAAELTNQLLAFGRRQMLRPEVLDLSDLIVGLEDMLGHILGEDIDFEVQLPREPLLVRADPGQLEQVLLNLAVNARDAMPTGGQLRLEGSVVELPNRSTTGLSLDPGSYVTFEVRDTGRGMDEETLRRIFDPFFSTKADGSGTGLGLASAYGIVKQSGGEILVRSKVGEGTVFTVYLPSAEGEVPAVKKLPKAPPTLEGNETILVVEDEAGILGLVQSILEDRGYRVITASSAEEAMESPSVNETPVDLLLTDVILPGMPGPDFADIFLERQPSAKVLFISGYSHQVIESHGLPSGHAELLIKPFSPEDLERRVREILG